jgi:hypothetical protein
MAFKLQSLLYIGLFVLCSPNVATSLPVDFINKQNMNTNTNTNTIKYPIRVACECENYKIYVDGKIVEQVDVIESYLENEWNATKIFIPDITTETPKIIAFHGTGGQFSGFANGFVMDMNNGADYTKYQEWKCAEFIPSAVPVNWYMYDYDDSAWDVSKSYGMNYQNNSYQIFETERLGIHLNAEWLWTRDNTKTNIFCRKKDTKVQTIPLQTSMAPVAASTTRTSVLKTTHYVPSTTAAPTTHASVLKTTHQIPATTAAPTTHTSVLKTTHQIPATTAAPTTHTSVLKTTHQIPATTAAPTTHTSVLKTTHQIPATTAPVAAPTTSTSVLKTTHYVPSTTAAAAAPTTRTSVLKTTHHVPATTAAAAPPTTITPLLKSEVKNIYNIKIIINNVKVSKDIIDKHMFNIFRYLHSVKSDKNDNDNVDDKLRRELYNIVKQTHTHIQSHYDRVVDYYKKLLRHQDQDQDQDSDDDTSDEYGRDEKGEKGEKNEIFRKSDSRLKKSSKIIESMMKLNHYIKVIEYKIHFIKGETRYDLLKILYSLKKQYQDDMIQMLKYFA